MMKNKEALQNALMKLAEGLYAASTVYTYCSEEEGELLTAIINSGVGDGFTQEKCCSLFQHSFDEEGGMMYSFVSQYIEERIEKDFHWNGKNIFMEQYENAYKRLVIGLETAVEGLEEVLHKEWKRELREYKDDIEYSPFGDYGFSVFLKKLKGFRKAYIAELTRQLGKRQLKKILDEAV